jgi:hypothetical protein
LQKKRSGIALVFKRPTIHLLSCILISGSSMGTGFAQQTRIRVPERPMDAMVAEPQTFPLWDGPASGALGNDEADRPTITYYTPVYSTHTAIVITPGGGYSFVATNHEGRQIANWLNSIGISAFVVKYRVGPRYHHPIELGDAQRGMRFVRAHATDFRINPDQPNRPRPNRSPELPPGFSHSGLSGNYAVSALRPSWLGDFAARRSS